ncbi:hypothetical protein CTAYLR_003834 [Chrysophaeum taylorii]|uniref:Spore protein YkvP/CgeB glycosyl transferase-like domain-containing protein n=1 Tax=Chrysophaeum taylorii TaxID=2483200 RepID=A0AAD7UED5_9STRA|nr:hypothetical protein CTAYLR_003834 [Chrysophaeum taylorii]
MRWRRLLLPLVVGLGSAVWVVLWRLLLSSYPKEEENKNSCDGGVWCLGVRAKVRICRRRVGVRVWSPEGSKGSVRLLHLLREGIEDHPMLFAGDEVVIWVPSHAPRPPVPAAIVLDERDSTAVAKPAYPGIAVFKRSVVKKEDGRFLGLVDNVWPFQYSISNAYVRAKEEKSKKVVDVACTLREGRGQYPLRGRVLAWTRRAMKRLNLSGVAGEVDSGSRTGFSDGYFEAMARAKIVVTANPGNWEGDFRTYEALASGALVFTDPLYAPMPAPFRNGTHWVVYDPHDEAQFNRLLEFYLKRDGERARIAARGRKHALRHHRAVSRIDWILASARPSLACDDHY